jgi:ribosomal protein S18 acetylase RimI-like enzyme
MTWELFDPWSVHSRRGFVAQQVAAGLSAEPEATASAERLLARLLPDGLATPHHFFWTVHAVGDSGDGPSVGQLWLQVRPLPGEVEAYLFDVEIRPAARGRGLGRAAMLAAEGAARDLGATVMRLNVFGHNTAAIGLYGSLGYRVTGTTMTARLGDIPAGRDLGAVLEMRDMTEHEYAGPRSAPAAADRLPPEGAIGGDDRLWTAYDGGYDGGLPIARMWLRLEHRSDGLHAFGRHLEVGAAQRRGYGPSLLLAVERACRDLGVGSLTLQVPDVRDGGWSLAARGGYRLTAQTMAKPL